MRTGGRKQQTVAERAGREGPRPGGAASPRGPARGRKGRSVTSSPRPVTTVVLAYEHRIFRAALRTLLEAKEEFEVVGECSDGTEAVDLAKRLGPDVIMLDLWLPHLSAANATRRICSEAPASKVVVLALRAPTSGVENAIRAGAAACLVGDSAPEEIFAALEAVGRGKCYLSPTVAQSVVEALSRPVEDSAPRLTAREREVLRLVADGLSTKEVASELRLATRTAESYRASLMAKLGIHKTSELVRFAIREGMIAP